MTHGAFKHSYLRISYHLSLENVCNGLYLLPYIKGCDFFLFLQSLSTLPMVRITFWFNAHSLIIKLVTFFTILVRSFLVGRRFKFMIMSPTVGQTIDQQVVKRWFSQREKFCFGLAATGQFGFTERMCRRVYYTIRDHCLLRKRVRRTAVCWRSWNKDM